MDIRKKLRLKLGDKVAFVEENGAITVRNLSFASIESIQSELSGEAERAGIRGDEDVFELVRQMRRERRGQK